MKVRVETLPPEGVRLSFRLAAENLPGLGELAAAEGCAFTGPARVEADVRPRAGVFLVSGRLRIPVDYRCSRCLAPFAGELTADFDVSFRSDAGEEALPADGEVEIRSEEMGTISFDGDEIDLGRFAEEQIVENFPMQPVCSDGCKGICAGCGADLNREECSCSGPGVDPRLAVLERLKGRLPK